MATTLYGRCERTGCGGCLDRVGHSGSLSPLHCGDLTTLHRRLFLAPHCTLMLSHLSVGGNANSTCRSRAMGTIGADCSWVARAVTPGPLPQPHGWVRLGLEVSRFPHFWVGGLACAEFPRGVEFRGSLAPFFFSTSLNKKIDVIQDMSEVKQLISTS